MSDSRMTDAKVIPFGGAGAGVGAVLDEIVKAAPLMPQTPLPEVPEIPEIPALPGAAAGEGGAHSTAGNVPVYPAAVSVMLRAYALPEQVPERLQFDRHLLRFNGLVPQERNRDLIWGVYGTESIGRANTYAAMDATRGGRRLYQLDLWYAVRRRDRGDWTRLLTAEEIRQNGFLQFQRLDADYRNHLRSLFLERLAEQGDPQLAELKLESSLEALVAQRPMLVHWLMQSCRWIMAVQHTVHIGTGVSLRIVTVRRDPRRYLNVSTRYHPEVETIVQS